MKAAVAVAFGVVCLLPRTEHTAATSCSGIPAAGAVCTIGGVDFLAIPGGTFAMGDSSPKAEPNERPVHDVTLDPFWLARTELTLRQWNAFLEATSHPKGRSGAQSLDHPVVSLTWDDANAYCDWMSRMHGRVVRLPSEAEWEFAARGGLRGRQYPNGDAMTRADANYSTGGAVKVATFAPNGYGLYDVAGNVFEWVGDWYGRDYYGVSPSRNPRGPAKDDAPQRRADRGGGWCMGIEKLRVAARHAGPGAWDEGGTADCLGFRPLMEIPAAP